MEIFVALAIGLALGYLVSQRGVTAPQQRSAAQATAASDEVFDAVRSSLGSIDLGVLVFDLSGREIYRNPAAHFDSLTRPAQAIIDGEVRDLVATVQRTGFRDISERPVELYGPPRTDLLVRALPSVADEASGVVVIIEDVTEARRLQEVRRSFVSNVSHELRTPVGAIAVLAETLAATDNPETVARLTGRLTSAAHRLGDMIEDLLELSTTESGDGTGFEPVSIAAVVNDAVGNLREPATGAGVEVSTSVPDDLVIDGHRRQLRSAIQNLLDNAIKYSEPGGEIKISAQLRNRNVRITVADQGIGIPEHDLDRVFERFYRVDAARRRETGGTGLGLAIVRHVAINHGGDVSAVSIEGEGTTFTIDLPLPVLPDGDAQMNEESSGVG